MIYIVSRYIRFHFLHFSLDLIPISNMKSHGKICLNYIRSSQRTCKILDTAVFQVLYTTEQRLKDLESLHSKSSTLSFTKFAQILVRTC